MSPKTKTKLRQPPRLQRQQRTALQGRGDYTVTTNEFNQLQSKLDRIERRIPDPKNMLSTAGGKVGGLFGMSDLGKSLGTGAASLLGFGDYNVVSNSLMKNVDVNGAIVPKFSNNGNNGVRVREREYLGDIVSGPTGQFTNKVYPLTPTDPNTFPWLHNIAQQFDQWDPHGIVLEFVSTSSDFNGSAQALGSVIMATDYDVLDKPFTNKIVMDNADYSSSFKPSVNQYHGIECDPKQRPYPILFTLPYDRAPANINTLGNFQIATAGVSAANVTLGELWISYDITFLKKQLEPVLTPVPHATLVGTYDNNAWNYSFAAKQGDWIVIAPTIATVMDVQGPLSPGRYMAACYLTHVYDETFLEVINATVVGYREDNASTTTLGPRLCTIVFDVSTSTPTIRTTFTYMPCQYSLAITEVPLDYVF